MSETVADVGEFGLIDRIDAVLRDFPRGRADLRLGIGDDAAIWRPEPDEDVVVTADSLIERVHFLLDWTTWEQLGWKSLAVNLSDLAGMGAEPALAEVSLSLTGEELVTDIEDFYRGMATLALQHKVSISGGDITATLLDRMIAVTLFGQTVDHQTLTRSAAKPGDLIVVTGLLGASAAGLALLQLPDDDPKRQAATAPLLIESHLRPVPRVEAGRMAAQHGVTAGMDLSDGLLGDLPKILRASDVDGILESDRVPIPAAVQVLFPAEAEQFALRGGEDYELLLTMSRPVFDDLQRNGAEEGITFTTVGEIIPQAGAETQLWLRDARGDLVPATAGAFDHFGSQ